MLLLCLGSSIVGAADERESTEIGETHLAFRLSAGWSVVTEYYGRNGRFRINNPARRFDQPNGWVAVGKIGVRRDTIAGTRVAVAVMIFANLDAELRERSGGDVTLDDLVRELSANGQPIGLQDLRKVGERLVGHESRTLHIDRLPGCRSIATEF